MVAQEGVIVFCQAESILEFRPDRQDGGRIILGQFDGIGGVTAAAAQWVWGRG